MPKSTTDASVGALRPHSDRLLCGVQLELRGIAEQIDDRGQRSTLAAIDAVLNELLGRQDTAFYAQFYGELVELARQGAALLARAADESDAVQAVAATAGALPREARSGADLAGLADEIEGVFRCLETIASSPLHGTAEALARWRQNLAVKEAQLLGHSQQAAPATTDPRKAARHGITRERLQAYLEVRFPEWPGLQVRDFKQLSGGYQKTTLVFTVLKAAGAREEMVLRAEKDERFITMDAGDVRGEFEIIRLVHGAGVQVAEPLWLEPDAGLLGQRFFVSRRVEGEIHGTAVAAETQLSSPLVLDFVKSLASIHSLALGDSLRSSPIGRWMQYRDLRSNTRANLAYWLEEQPWLKHAGPSPALKRLGSWLAENIPADEAAPCFLHGDFGLHNVLVKNDKVAAVLDWEVARIGDPAEDISWFLQSCAGKIDVRDLLRRYEDLTGRRVSEYRLRYFDVFNCMKLVIGAACAAAMYDASPGASIQWCNIPLLWGPVFVAGVERQIAAAEASRSRG